MPPGPHPKLHHVDGHDPDLESDGGRVQPLLRLLGVIAPKVSRRAPERSYWGQGRKFDRDSRFTPPCFLAAIRRAFGPIDIDPCGHQASPVIARRRFLLSNGDDGLTDRWSGRLAFVNPPFSAQLEWLRRAHDQWSSGAVEVAICLVPVRTDSEFFQETVAADADVFLIRGRLPFLDADGKSQATPFSLMLVAFGASQRQKDAFVEAMPGLWIRPMRRGSGTGAEIRRALPKSIASGRSVRPVASSPVAGDCMPEARPVRRIKACLNGAGT